MKNFYITFLAITFLTSLTSNAQIVYEDISPDVTTTISGPGNIDSLVPIDFDGNGAEEYNFRWDHFGQEDGWYLHMTFASTNEIAFISDSNLDDLYIIPMVNGELINDSLDYGNNFPLPEPFIGNGEFNTNFMGLGDRYVGCKFTISGNTHYGWVRVNLENNLNFVVKDYAYESTPNTPIEAGDIGATANVEDVEFNNYFNSYPNPVLTNLVLEVKQQIKISSFNIYNIVGQQFNVPIQSSSSKIIFNVESLESGVYFLQIQTESNTILTKKIIVE